jgi:hypothetical protein
MGVELGLQGLDRITAPDVTPEMRAHAIARISREYDAHLLLDILGLGE